MEDASLGVIIFASFLAITIPLISGSPAGPDIQEGDVRLVGGSHGLEGRAEIYHNGQWLGICYSSGDTTQPGSQHEWEFPEGDVFCKQLGYDEGVALIFDGAQTAAKFGNPTSSTYLTNIDCGADINVPGLQSCNHVMYGSQCDENLGYVSLSCRVPGFEGCYLHSEPGFLDGHEIVANSLTLSTCLDLCSKPPGPYRYAGIRSQGHCQCGNSLQSALKVDDHQCFTPCPTDDEQPCGGVLRMAVYDLNDIISGNAPPHIIWPIWGNRYTASDNNKVVRVTIPAGYDYALLKVILWDLADNDRLILRSSSRDPGFSILGATQLTLPYRWITDTATWFEVATVVIPTTTGGLGFIIKYEFGKHCSAAALPEIPGGNWRSGDYYDRECPLPICNPGYQPQSSAVCQLDGTWIGTGSCIHIPEPVPTLFPPNPPQTNPPTAPAATTLPPPPPPPSTPAPPPVVTQPPEPPVPPATTKAPEPPPVEPTNPPIRSNPPPGKCYLPNIDQDSGTLIGTGFRAVFYENDRITHCCTHKVSDCVELFCQGDGTWSNIAYTMRCPKAVCTVPATNENGNVGNPAGKSYFEERESLSLCCVNSDYCFVLTCLEDGTWLNMDELLGCPPPMPPPKDDDFPVWLIAVLITAGVIAVTIVLVSLIVCCCRMQSNGQGGQGGRGRQGGKGGRGGRGEDQLPLTKQRPYTVEAPERYRYPSPTRKPDPPIIVGEYGGDKDYRDYREYGPNPIIIGGGTKYKSRHPQYHRQQQSRREYYERRRDQYDPRRDDPRDDRRDRRDRSRRDRRSEKSPRRRDVDEASALGALNNVVQDFADSESVSSSNTRSTGSS